MPSVIDMDYKRNWIVAITGASGAIYGVTLIQSLLRLGYHVHVLVSDAGWRVLHEELGWHAGRREQTLREQFPESESAGKLIIYPNQDIGARIASGSFRCAGMAVVPCSMGTLAGIAQGTSDSLLKRAADVVLKEGRKLILVPRETPLNAIHLENMLKLARIGVHIVPAMPAYYTLPQSIEDLVRFQVGKILDLMSIDHGLYKRWGEPDEPIPANHPYRTN